MAMDKVKVNNEEVLKDRLVAINRVTKVTKGGRTFTFAAIVVVGDGNGVIGYGLGKAGEVTAAIAKGTEAAKKNLVKVPVLKGTVPHEVETAFGGAKVLIKPENKHTSCCKDDSSWNHKDGPANTRCQSVSSLHLQIQKVTRSLKDQDGYSQDSSVPLYFLAAALALALHLLEVRYSDSKKLHNN